MGLAPDMHQLGGWGASKLTLAPGSHYSLHTTASGCIRLSLILCLHVFCLVRFS